MDLTDIKDLYRNREAYIDKEVTIGGWVRSIRDSKTFGFIVVNDGTFFELLSEAPVGASFRSSFHPIRS